MDPDTLAKAFDLPDVPKDVDDDAEETAEVDDAALDEDVALAFDTGATPEDRREAFIRAVKAAMKG